VELGLHVVPRRTVAVGVVDVDGLLRVAEVTRIVVTPVAEVDATHERDVVVGTVAPPGDEQLLVVAPTPPHALVEQDLAAGRVDDLREREVASSVPGPTSRSSGSPSQSVKCTQSSARSEHSSW
jgi:hypothetical protein